MVIGDVDVAARRIALPNLDERAGHWFASFVHDSARHDDPLADRLACMLPREIVVRLANRQIAIDGRPEILEVSREPQRWLRRRAPHRRLIGGMQEPGLRRVEIAGGLH